MIDLKTQSCIAACSAAAIAALHCANSDLNDEGTKIQARCIKLNHDCAAICFLAIEAMAGSSEFTKHICNLCSEICNTCAMECEKHAHMEHCKKCAEACRKCAVECNNMNHVPALKN